MERTTIVYLKTPLGPSHDAIVERLQAKGYDVVEAETRAGVFEGLKPATLAVIFDLDEETGEEAAYEIGVATGMERMVLLICGPNSEARRKRFPSPNILPVETWEDALVTLDQIRQGLSKMPEACLLATSEQFGFPVALGKLLDGNTPKFQGRYPRVVLVGALQAVTLLDDGRFPVESMEDLKASLAQVMSGQVLVYLGTSLEAAASTLIHHFYRTAYRGAHEHEQHTPDPSGNGGSVPIA